MEAQLRANGADRPVLDLVQAQDLGFERARDHRRSLPLGPAAVAHLVAGTGAAQRFAPANPRALRGAVLMAAVAVPDQWKAGVLNRGVGQFVGFSRARMSGMER
jgi:hypothetical protein